MSGAHTLIAQPIAAANSPEWHALRQQGIGASESAAACGLSRWELPLDVWSRKVYGHQKDESDAMLLGTLMEPVVCAFFMRKTGHEVVTESPGLYQHPEIPWMLASPDGVLADGTGAEFKTTTSRNGELGDEGTDEIPVEWITQGQQQIAVCNFPAVRFGVLIDGREFREYVVERNTKLIDRLIEREGELWQKVESRTPPDLDFSHTHAARAARDAFRSVSEGVEIMLDDEADELAEEYAALGRTSRDADKRRNEVKAQLLMRLQDAEKCLLPSGGMLVRKQIGESQIAAYTRKSYVTLTQKAPKKT